MPEIMQAGGQTQWVDLGASVNSTLSLSHLPSCGSCAQHLEMEVSAFKYQMSAGMIIFFFSSTAFILFSDLVTSTRGGRSLEMNIFSLLLSKIDVLIF